VQVTFFIQKVVTNLAINHCKFKQRTSNVSRGALLFVRQDESLSSSGENVILS
jgi:hypothetical protein